MTERIQRIREAVEEEAKLLMQQGNLAASNALFELLLDTNDVTLRRFADIVIQSDAEAGYIP